MGWIEGKGGEWVDLNGDGIAYDKWLFFFCCVRVCGWRKRETSCVCSPRWETRLQHSNHSGVNGLLRIQQRQRKRHISKVAVEDTEQWNMRTLTKDWIECIMSTCRRVKQLNHWIAPWVLKETKQWNGKFNFLFDNPLNQFDSLGASPPVKCAAGLTKVKEEKKLNCHGYLQNPIGYTGGDAPSESTWFSGLSKKN